MSQSSQSKTKKNSETEHIPEDIAQKIAKLEEQLQLCRESERRAQADYQNLTRRSQEERQQLVKFAEKSLIEDLLQPLDHLDLAAQQLSDKGLLMVVEQLWKALAGHGLKQLEVMGQPYNVETMEVIEIVDSTPEAEAVVVKIVKNGYQLNDVVIQHAKVILGKAAE